jgi:alkylhydroperoxidase family enzyme
MAMVQGYSREDVKNILDNVNETTLIDEKTRNLILLAEKATRHPDTVRKNDVEELKAAGCSEEEIYEAIAVTSLFNFLDRMADALGAPVEGLQDLVEQMQQS